MTKVRILDPQKGDIELGYDIAKTETQEYLDTREEIMKRIKQGYRAIDKTNSKLVELDEGQELPDTGELWLLFPISGG